MVDFLRKQFIYMNLLIAYADVIRFYTFLMIKNNPYFIPFFSMTVNKTKNDFVFFHPIYYIVVSMLKKCDVRNFDTSEICKF